MIRRLLFVLTYVLVFGPLHAQTDTTRPPAVQPVQVQDTVGNAHPAADRHDSAIHHPSHRDSVRRDSILRVRRAVRDSLRRDSLRRLQNTATADSLAKAPPAANTPPANTTQAAPVRKTPPMVKAAAAEEGPPALSFWHKVLAASPVYNFTGKPVVEIFEVHRSNSKDSLFYLLVGILFYFALIRIFFTKYLDNLITLFFRVSLRQQQIREQVLQTPLPSLLLNILFIVSAGLYACFLLHYSKIGEGVRFWVIYFYCMVLLGSIYLVKFLVLKFVGWVFSISRATDIYIFVVFLVNKMMGIFLLPFLILITFSGSDVREIFITISLAMVFVLWTYRSLASYRPVRNEIKLTPFYFLLYLCAFEIAPLLLIYKVLLTYLEKVY
jgi:Domain of unknown function (DUF4271)